MVIMHTRLVIMHTRYCDGHTSTKYIVMEWYSYGLVQFVLMLNVNHSLAKARPTMLCIHLVYRHRGSLVFPAGQVPRAHSTYTYMLSRVRVRVEVRNVLHQRAHVHVRTYVRTRSKSFPDCPTCDTTKTKDTTKG